ncbi:MAG: EmrB/QacA family drug resistance transporter, partial [Marinobacter sp.]|nr:EmrB/QacA family drug resistance transporter [Marinobacter sp.]
VAWAARNTQTNHAVLGEQLTPFREPVQKLMEGQGVGMSSDQALAMLNGELTRQSAAIGYLNDFQAMAWMTLAALPLILLFRGPSRKPDGKDGKDSEESQEATPQEA